MVLAIHQDVSNIIVILLLKVLLTACDVLEMIITLMINTQLLILQVCEDNIIPNNFSFHTSLVSRDRALEEPKAKEYELGTIISHTQSRISINFGYYISDSTTITKRCVI